MEIDEDNSLILKDLIKGGDIKVTEKIGTRYVVKYDKIITRIVRNGENNIMTGSALIIDSEFTSKTVE